MCHFQSQCKELHDHFFPRMLTAKLKLILLQRIYLYIYIYLHRMSVQEAFLLSLLFCFLVIVYLHYEWFVVAAVSSIVTCLRVCGSIKKILRIST